MRWFNIGICKYWVFWSRNFVSLIFFGFGFSLLEGWLWVIISLVVFCLIIFWKIFLGWIRVFVVVLMVIILVVSKWFFMFSMIMVKCFWVCYIKFWFKAIVVVLGLFIIIFFKGWFWNICLFNFIVVKIVVVLVGLMLGKVINFWGWILCNMFMGFWWFCFNCCKIYCFRFIVDSLFLFWFVVKRMVINLVFFRCLVLYLSNFFLGCLFFGRLVIFRL